MDFIECTTQSEVDAVKPGDIAIVRAGFFTASGSATVTAYGSATVTAYDSATVTASKFVAVHKQSKRTTITGGVLLTPPDLNECDAATWLDFYGVEVTKAGYATLYKAVDDTYQTGRGERWTYKPGARLTPEVWDAGRFCGDGLHLCARPFISARYLSGATKYVAVKVKAADCVPLGDKVKVPALTVLHEVDIDGNKVRAS